MAKICVMVFVTILLILLINNQSVNTLKCYRCSTLAEEGELCDDPFSAKNLTYKQKLWLEAECSAQLNDPNRPACKKTKKKVDGKVVIERSCVWGDSNPCSNMAGPKSQYNACEICTTDLCNEAMGFNSFGFLTLIPLILGKMLVF